MNIPTDRRRFWVFASLVIIVIIVVSAIIAIEQSHKSPYYTKKLVDRDTGETALITPNQQVEKAAGGNSLIIFGSSVIFSDGATQFQYNQLKSAVDSYWQKNLASRYQSMTFIPSSFTANAGDLKGQMRLGQTDTKVNVEVKLTNLFNVQFLVKDPSGKNGGSFDSGVLPTHAQNP